MSDRVEELKKRAYDLGYKYEGEWGNCSQASYRALMETYDQIDKEAFRGLAGFHGGGGCETDASCGAYVGSTYFISQRYGRDLDDLGTDPDDPKASRKHRKMNEVIKKLHDRFVEEYGSVICENIHRKLYGRAYYLRDKDEIKKFNEAGAHDWGCTSVVGKAAAWTVEILEAEKA
jgi:C_GCAxxG_C_C family probable redox protein